MIRPFDSERIEALRGRYYVAACLVLGLGSAGCVETVALAWLESTADRPWALAHIVKPRRPRGGGRFGAALALTNRHLLVGAPTSFDCGGPVDGPLDCEGGAVNAWWRPLERGATPVLLKSAGADTRFFGAAISACTGKIWVGAPGDRPSQVGRVIGAVAEHARSGVDWSDPVEIASPDLPAGPGYGQRVALAPPWAAVLEPEAYCPDQAAATGLVRVMYFTTAGGWVTHGTVCLDQGAPPGFAGNTRQLGDVAIVSERLVVGVPWTKDSTVGRVVVYRLDRNPAEGDEPIVLEQELRPEVAAAVRPDGFGVTVAADTGRIYVGAPGEGAVYTFKYSQEQGRWYQEQRLGSDGSDSLFGTAVAVSQQQLLVGAPKDDNCALGIDPPPTTWSRDCGSTRGAAFLYVLNPDEIWTERHYLKPPTVSSPGFGAAVAISGSTFAVGAPSDTTISIGIDGELDPINAATGAVFVYKRVSDDAL